MAGVIPNFFSSSLEWCMLREYLRQGEQKRNRAENKQFGPYLSYHAATTLAEKGALQGGALLELESPWSCYFWARPVGRLCSPHTLTGTHLPCSPRCMTRARRCRSL